MKTYFKEQDNIVEKKMLLYISNKNFCQRKGLGFLTKDLKKFYIDNFKVNDLEYFSGQIRRKDAI